MIAHGTWAWIDLMVPLGGPAWNRRREINGTSERVAFVQREIHAGDADNYLCFDVPRVGTLDNFASSGEFVGEPLGLG